QHAKALPLAERYVQANPNAGDTWLQFLVGANAELKRYEAAERWQRRLLLRHPHQTKTWRQLAGLQQMAGDEDKALATLRAAHAQGLRFSESELDNLVLLASAAGQPWQGAKLLEGMLESRLLATNATAVSAWACSGGRRVSARRPRASIGSWPLSRAMPSYGSTWPSWN